MKAVQINKYGGVEVLEVNDNVPRPIVSPNQVLAEVYAASINPIDWKVRSGYLKDFMPLKFPATLGGDFSGVVVEVGTNVTEFKAGDKIYGSAIILNGSSGAFAQTAAVNTKNISIKPENVDFITSAALPLVGTSALQALEETIKLESGQKILIHGGAGGIGHIAIQLAKAKGAYVATTSSTQNVEFAKTLGADEVIDYKKQSFETIIKDFDAVFDTVGGEVVEKSFSVLRKGGVLVSMVGQPSQELAQKYTVSAVGQNTVTNTQHLIRLAELIESGKIKVNIEKVFPLDEVQQAFKYQEEVHPRGKVVLKVI